ncbi:MAG: flagellar hook-associated protein FlgK [Fretibacterium sp.]|nr:flagellar hook-associated protein FlgK [Fretibacterium sp.]
MLNSFFGLEMSKRALNAFRTGIEVAGHNVSNVKTEGYSRQRVNLSTTDPYTEPGLSRPAIPGQIGTGVKVDEIVRIRDEFLDLQYRTELADLGYWEKVNQLYDAIQLYIAEPNQKGVRAAFDTFFDSLQALQKDPEIAAVRESVVQAAKTLGAELGRIIQGFDTYADSINAEVKSSVEQANITLHEIAALNKRIYALKALGQNPNDLLDKRDLLLDKISRMMDVDIQEPIQRGDSTGEFFLTLNGRTLIQGDRVRELVAHPFFWDDKVYYDVQVAENEFDIVENCEVARALATGPEGVHQLVVDRLANGEEWAVGGEDPYCLEPDGTLKQRPVSSLTTKTFAGGVILEAGTTDGETRALRFRVPTAQPHPPFYHYDVAVTLTWNAGAWTITNDQTPLTTPAGPDVTVDELADYLGNVFAADAFAAGDLTVTKLGGPPATSFSVTSGDHTIELLDSHGILGANVEYVRMRLRPQTPTEALGVLGSFRIQVGSQGTRVASRIFRNENEPDLDPGDILGPGTEGDSYTFRVGAHQEQVDITVYWDEPTNRWRMKSDVFADADYFVAAANIEKLTVTDLSNFLRDALPQTGMDAFAVESANTQFAIRSVDNWLISISDVHGDLAARMGMVNPNPVIEIDVVETDSLETIRNKINEKYQAEFGLIHPEQWVHASLKQDADQSWYLTIAADVAGEAQRITLLPGSDGNAQILRRLGLLGLRKKGETAEGFPVYREVTAYLAIAEDASFTFDGVRYLSADNKFKEARRVPAGANRNDYTARQLSIVREGLWLELRGIGNTAITVRHHVRGGSIKGLEEARDALIPDLKAGLDDVAWELVKNFNAYQYSGYGIGNNINMTGVAFFEPYSFKADAASRLHVNDAVERNVSLIGAAMGKPDPVGRAIYGRSGGPGDGKNATRMAGMKNAKLLDEGSASFGQFYEAYIARIGAEAGRAALMYKAQENLTSQIDWQRQTVMGVNLEEEMLNIMMFTQAFNAMSRYATTIDEMLDRLINGFGLAGR